MFVRGLRVSFRNSDCRTPSKENAVNSNNVEADFQRTVSAQVRLVRESEDRFRVLTPFVLEDGDHLSIILKREDGKWILSDEGHTYMQLSYDLTNGHVFADGRGEKIREALGFFSLSDREGEIIREVENSNFGEALYAFVQGLIRIAEVSVSLRKAEQTIESESSIVAKESKALSLPRFRAAWRSPRGHHLRPHPSAGRLERPAPRAVSRALRGMDSCC